MLFLMSRGNFELHRFVRASILSVCSDLLLDVKAPILSFDAAVHGHFHPSLKSAVSLPFPYFSSLFVDIVSHLLSEMAFPSSHESPEELAAMNDFRVNIWSAFQPYYEDKWDQELWDAAVARFKAAHDPVVVTRFMKKARLPAWDALEDQMRKGPPAFLRPGWTSPLLGSKTDLEWLDMDKFECIRPSKDDWRDKKVLIIEYWASWCRPCHVVCGILSNIVATEPDVKVITFNHEGIFTKAEIDRAVVKNFIDSRNDMDYPIYIDSERVAVEALFEPGQNLSIPLVFVITIRDQIIRWIGNPEEIAAPLEDILKSV
ncbi:uncharacterized protein FIBRA_07183 [Fibroporia radiculosa]|uniref:Thioredoxin domain-containing protein n=1 Tax=Fibroporia radiculosa TaxID=599839 RepID=J4GUH2_9APHY|nr:uncharacterized protein FIBRA_07183 [Fibroporia radiculosa]CCM04985.1 predicted protein [Fibroporia radiculosa]